MLNETFLWFSNIGLPGRSVTIFPWGTTNFCCHNSLSVSQLRLEVQNSKNIHDAQCLKVNKKGLNWRLLCVHLCKLWSSSKAVFRHQNKYFWPLKCCEWDFFGEFEWDIFGWFSNAVWRHVTSVSIKNTHWLSALWRHCITTNVSGPPWIFSLFPNFVFFIGSRIFGDWRPHRNKSWGSFRLQCNSPAPIAFTYVPRRQIMDRQYLQCGSTFWCICRRFCIQQSGSKKLFASFFHSLDLWMVSHYFGPWKCDLCEYWKSVARIWNDAFYR